MTTKDFIEAAIEGGWEDTRPEISVPDNENMSIFIQAFYDHAFLPKILLDPTAWQAIGKVKRWGNRTSRVCICGMCRIPDEQVDRLIWENQMAQH